MKRDSIVIHSGKDGNFKLGLAQTDIAQVHFADVDLILMTKDGKSYVLPGAALAAMETHPPTVSFTDGSQTADKLLAAVEAVEDPLLNTRIMESPSREEEKPEDEEKLKEKLEEQRLEIIEAQEKIEQQEKELQEAKEQVEAQDEKANDMAAMASQQKAAEEAQEKAEKIIEQLHNKDYDYVPPREYQPQGAAFAGSPGVPAPISMNPLVVLTMGNSVGELVVGATIYGDGGAAGSGAEAKFGPRDALQFSDATITGTAGADVIYAEGPLVGNANPAVSTANYAKEFLLRVSGYFTDLSDIVFQGLPAYVSVTGAVLQPDGSWVLPADYVITQQTFQLVYDKDGWRAEGADTFDMTIVVTGEMRDTTFTSTEKIRFQFMDVTSVEQVTDSTLTYWDEGQNKHIYILPTQDQPNVINADAGNDQIYGGRNADTIDAGDGDDVVFAFGGMNDVQGGLGDDQITTGDDNDIIDAGDGNNTIVAGGGDDIIASGDGDDTLSGDEGDDILRGGLGTNVIDGGEGTNTVDYTGLNTAIAVSLVAGTATGVGVADTLTLINNVTGSSFDDVITGDASVNTLSGAAGADIIVGGGGNDFFYGGDGDDSITGGAGNDTVYGGAGNDTIDAGGTGTDVLHGDDGDDIFINPSIGTVYDGGAGVDKVDYSAQAFALVIDLSAGTGYSGSVQWATYISIEWIVSGSAADTLTGSSGNDILEGRAGNDTLTGGAGDDTLIGGTGTTYYRMGLGADYIVATGTANYDQLEYYGSSSAIVVNLDDEEHSFVNSKGATVTVAALTGSSREETAADTASWSLGDTYTAGGAIGTYTAGGIDMLYGTAYNDVVFGSDEVERFYLYGGDDTVFAGGGNDYLLISSGNERWDGGEGNDLLYTGNTSANMTVYLDGTVDLNTNGKADYIDKGATNFAGSGYEGFIVGWGSGKILLTSVENIVGGGGSDILVGDDGINHISGLGGNNLLYGLGGDDIIFAQSGASAIDGGTGQDTISFSNVDTNLSSTTTGAYGYNSAISVEIYLADADLDGNGVMDRAGTWTGHTGDTSRTNSGGIWSYSTVTGVENIVGTINADKLAGDANANLIRGYSGNDLITGNGGADSLYGDAGNDTFVINSAHIAGTTLISGGAGTDTLRSSGWNFAANSIYADNAKYANLESVNVRNSAAGGSNTLTAYDIQSMVDSGNSSSLTFYADTGDTVTYSIGAGTGALSCLNTTHNATTDVYKYYSDAGHVINNSTNLVAIVTVYYG